MIKNPTRKLALLSPATGSYLLPLAKEDIQQDIADWRSHLDFCRTELDFLYQLLDKVFLRATTMQRQQALDALQEKVQFLNENVLLDLQEQINYHGRNLLALDENTWAQNTEIVRQEHLRKLARLKSYTEKLTRLKKEIFSAVEEQMKLAKEIRKDFEEGKLAL